MRLIRAFPRRATSRRWGVLFGQSFLLQNGRLRRRVDRLPVDPSKVSAPFTDAARALCTSLRATAVSYLLAYANGGICQQKNTELIDFRPLILAII